MKNRISMSVEKKTCGTHFHSELEFFYILRGQVSVLTMGKSFTLEPDDLLVFSPYQTHDLQYHSGSVTLSVLLPAELVPEMERKQIFCNSRLQPERAEAVERLREILAVIVYILRSESDEYQLYLMSAAYEILGILNLYFTVDASKASGDRRTEWLPEILRYIDEHYCDPLTLREISEVFHISEGHLSRVLSGQLGQPFGEYLRSRRTARAAVLLKETSLPLPDIAAECGFLSASTLIENFRKEFGMTPGTYKKQLASSPDRGRPYGSGEPAVSENLLSALYARLKPEDMEKLHEQRWKITPTELVFSIKRGAPWEIEKYRDSVTIYHAKYLLYETVRDAVRQARDNIGFHYLHFHGILDDIMNVCRENPDGSFRFNFIYVDLALDFLLSAGIRPWIELGYTPLCLSSRKKHFLGDSCIDLPDDPDKWGRLLEELLLHLVRRYGEEELSGWRFSPVYALYSYHQMFSLDAYMEYYAVFYQLVRRFVPKASIAAFGVELETVSPEPEGDLFRLLSMSRERNILPDLLDFQHFHMDYAGVDVVAFEKAVREQDSGISGIHPDPELLSVQLDLVRQIQLSVGSDIPVTVGSWNCGIWQREISNDTCFKAAFILKNCLENAQGLAGLSYSDLTDFTDQILTDPAAFHGGRGLFTCQNMKKPAAFAYDFLLKLEDVLVEKGPGYCVTRDRKNRRIVMLLYNYKHYRADAGEEGRSVSGNSLYERYHVYHYHRKASFHIRFSDLVPGEYRLEAYTVNRSFGSSYDKWMEMGRPARLQDYQLSYLKRQTIPRYECLNAHITDSGCYDLSYLLDLHEIKLVILEMPHR